MSISTTIKQARCLKERLKQIQPKLYDHINTLNKTFIFYIRDPPKHCKDAIEITYEIASLLAGFALLDEKKIIIFVPNFVDIPNSASLIIIRTTQYERK